MICASAFAAREENNYFVIADDQTIQTIWNAKMTLTFRNVNIKCVFVSCIKNILGKYFIVKMNMIRIMGSLIS